MKKLKNTSTPGCDGITTEHLKYALDSKLPLCLCVLFSLCVRTGITPDKFNMEIMVSVLKKTTLDPGCAANYRPITISVTLSKILDLHIFDRCKDHALSDAQFGFVQGRSTDMATAVTHDVGAYCVAKGSSALTQKVCLTSYPTV